LDKGDGVYGEHEIDYILFLQKEVDLKPNSGEVSEIRWLKRENLDEQIASLDGPLTPWFRLIFESGQLALWWNNLHRLKKFEDYNSIHKLN
jgi:isopentenyl-diphosphate Delta-isomerase